MKYSKLFFKINKQGILKAGKKVPVELFLPGLIIKFLSKRFSGDSQNFSRFCFILLSVV